MDGLLPLALAIFVGMMIVFTIGYLVGWRDGRRLNQKLDEVLRAQAKTIASQRETIAQVSREIDRLTQTARDIRQGRR